MNAPFVPSPVTLSLVELDTGADVRRIDGFVGEMEGSIFHRPQWLIAGERACGHRALGLVATRRGIIEGWLPLSIVHSAIFGRALVSSAFGVGGGVLASDPDTARALVRAACELAARHACASVELRGGVMSGLTDGLMDELMCGGWHINTSSHAGFVADLAGDDKAQLLAIPRKQRAEVRKSLGMKLTVSTGRSLKDRAAHYAVYAQSVHNLGTPVFPQRLFDCMLAAFPDDADILTVWHDTDAGAEPVASVLSFYHKGAVLPFWGGGVFAARALRANERMYYALMQHARTRAMTRFDFGRSKRGSGPYRYKRNWGFNPAPLSYASRTLGPQKARNIDPSHPSYQRKIALWKRLPLPLANRLGPLIAAGLA